MMSNRDRAKLNHRARRMVLPTTAALIKQQKIKAVILGEIEKKKQTDK